MKDYDVILTFRVTATNAYVAAALAVSDPDHPVSVEVMWPHDGRAEDGCAVRKLSKNQIADLFNEDPV